MKNEATIKGTCQVCGRRIGAKIGTVAHHGYRRPGYGWQTDSCAGAQYVPYEQSCERLAEVVKDVEGYIAATQKLLTELLISPPETISMWVKFGSYGAGKQETYDKPEGFGEVSYKGSTRPHTYADLYSTKLYGYKRDIAGSEETLARMKKRVQEWTPAQVQEAK
jgi:hypothetical protein